jgi:hypothetical protein
MWHTGIHSNMNFPAPIAVMGFLAAVAGLAISGLTAAVFTLVRKMRWTRRVGAIVAAGAMIYFGLLFGFSLASRDVTLAPGEEKYFCELDCHLAYSVHGASEELKPHGRELHITLRTRFDETTTAPWRPRNAPLTPNARQVFLVDSQGHRYSPELLSGTPLNRPLVPAQSYDTELTFRLPADANGLRLLVTTLGWDERLLIGEENSLGHKKTYLALPAA